MRRWWYFTEKTYVVNGMVHSICSAKERLIVYIQRPEHFRRCDDCHIYSTFEDFTAAQSMIQLGVGLDGFVECSTNCPYCNGRTVYFGHPWDASLKYYDTKKKSRWSGWRLPPPSGVLGAC